MPLLLVIAAILAGWLLMKEYDVIKAAPFLDDFERATAKFGLPGGLLARVAKEESAFDPSAVSPVGAQGLFQFMPATANDFGIDPMDPAAATYAAAKYLRQLFDQFGTWSMALAAYNWGPGNLARHGIDSAPDETVRYVSDITGDLGLP